MKFSTIQISGGGPSVNESIEKLDISLVKCTAKCVALLCRTSNGTFIYPEGPQDTDLWFGFTLTLYSPQSAITLGFKSITEMDAGYVYAPYVPLHTSSNVKPQNFNVSAAMRQKYGLKLVNQRVTYPTLYWLYNQHEMYEAIKNDNNLYQLGDFKLPDRYIKYKPDWDEAIAHWIKEITVGTIKSDDEPYGSLTIG